MTFYLAATQAGIFFIKSVREAILVIRKFLPANIFGRFLFDPPSFINAIFNVLNS